MVIDETVKTVIEQAAYLSLVTVASDGTPHPIIVGKGAVQGDNVVFGIYKMEQTQKNLLATNKLWMVAATLDGGPKGYRLSGTAKPDGEKLIFAAEKAEALL
ncbi:MAG: pyridoxamine 5'-phosphate oxidase family protein [Anaerofustis sp.]